MSAERYGRFNRIYTVYLTRRVIRGPVTGKKRETRVYAMTNVVRKVVGDQVVIDIDKSDVVEWSSTRNIRQMIAAYEARGIDAFIVK